MQYFKYVFFYYHNSHTQINFLTLKLSLSPVLQMQFSRLEQMVV